MTGRETESRQSDEPSLEEILASIRQIVFENDGGEAASGRRDGKAGPEASETAPEPAAAVAPADEPSQGDGTDPAEGGEELPGKRIAGETDSAAKTESRPETELPEPPESEKPVADDSNPADRADPAGHEADESGAGPGETVLLLTDMIAPDGSVVRIDPRPAQGRGETPPGEGSGEQALDAATQDNLAATVREWLDRNAPGMVDRAARRELHKLADRQE